MRRSSELVFWHHTRAAAIRQELETRHDKWDHMMCLEQVCTQIWQYGLGPGTQACTYQPMLNNFGESTSQVRVLCNNIFVPRS